MTTANEMLDSHTNESYALDTRGGVVIVTAVSVYGAMRGLETLSQLIRVDAVNARGLATHRSIPELLVRDAPRFGYRSFMIDTARHFLPVATIFTIIDALAYAKFNLLHWHIVDGQAFPFASTAHPCLAAGAFDVRHRYSAADVQHIIDFARARGVRVVPEFDSPGHTFPSWGVGCAHLLTQCFDSSGAPSGFGPLNPTDAATQQFVSALYTEIAATFHDDYLHVGGDEVSFDCWKSNPAVQKWMRARNWTDFALLEQYYLQHVVDTVQSLKRHAVVWQDVFVNGVALNRSSVVIDVWRSNWLVGILFVSRSRLTDVNSTGNKFFRMPLSKATMPWCLHHGI